MKKILAFAGSNSKTSINHILVKEASNLISDIEVQLISLRDFEAPVYGIDVENNDGFPKSMVDLYNLFTEADGFIVGVPEHNGSMPSVMKNTLDWISRQGGKIFQNKHVVFLGTSPGGRGGASAMKHVLDIMPHRGAIIVGHYSLPNFNEHYRDGILISDKLDELREIMNNLNSALMGQ